MKDISRHGAVCIFCLFHRDREQPETCTYGMRHEYPEDSVVTAPKKQQEAKVDRSRCTRCGLHPKNPVFAASQCQHEFPQ